MKTLKLLALCCVSALLLTSCEQHHDTGGPMPVAVEAPKIIIPVQEAENMYHRYGENTATLIESAINVDDQGNPISADDPAYVQATRSLTVDYAIFKQYLAFIEQESKKANTDITGLRFYFSEYPAAKNDGRATIFFNPVMKYGTRGVNDDVAFAIDNSGTTPEATFVKNVITVPRTQSNQANLTMTTQGPIQSLAGNRLPWRPPPPPPNDPDYQ